MISEGHLAVERSIRAYGQNTSTIISKGFDSKPGLFRTKLDDIRQSQVDLPILQPNRSERGFQMYCPPLPAIRLVLLIPEFVPRSLLQDKTVRPMPKELRVRS